MSYFGVEEDRHTLCTTMNFKILSSDLYQDWRRGPNAFSNGKTSLIYTCYTLYYLLEKCLFLT